jgi:hypothetical protein
MTSLGSIRTARLLCEHKQYTDLCSRLVTATSEVTSDLTALINPTSFYTRSLATKGWFKTRVTITRTDSECTCGTVGARGGNYEDFYILGYNAVWSVQCRPTFRKNMSPSSSGSKDKPSM